MGGWSLSVFLATLLVLPIALPPAFARSVGLSVCPEAGAEAAKSRWKQQINGGRRWRGRAKEGGEGGEGGSLITADYNDID